MRLATRQPGSPLLVIPFPTVTMKVPVTWDRGALKCSEAAAYLRISRSQLWLRTQTGKIRQTIDGTYAITELDRYLRENLKQI